MYTQTHTNRRRGTNESLGARSSLLRRFRVQHGLLRRREGALEGDDTITLTQAPGGEHPADREDLLNDSVEQGVAAVVPLPLQRSPPRPGSKRQADWETVCACMLYCVHICVSVCIHSFVYI